MPQAGCPPTSPREPAQRIDPNGNAPPGEGLPRQPANIRGIGRICARTVGVRLTHSKLGDERGGALGVVPVHNAHGVTIGR